MKPLSIIALTISLSALLLAPALIRAETGRTNFIAILSSNNEVPSHDTHARGVAKIQISPDGTTLQFHLISANIENVVMAHIHIAPAGTNGPVVLFLYGPAAPGGGRFDGVLASGSRASSNLVGPLAGIPLSALVDAMIIGNAYVNVHTNDGVDPANTGPGDFPGGEIRGQIRLAD